MGTTFDARQALTAMVSAITAYSSATGVSTATIATSIAAQATADTGLTGYETNICTAVSAALSSVTPSTNIHNLAFSINPRVLVAAMTSVLTALSSATGVSTSNFSTQLSSVITADAGMSSVESTMVTAFLAAIGSAQPSSSVRAQSNVDELQLVTWFSDTMRALCLTQASGTTTSATQMVTSIASQVSADTGLTNQEKTLVTSISSAINSTTPSSSIHFGKL